MRVNQIGFMIYMRSLHMISERKQGFLLSILAGMKVLA